MHVENNQPLDNPFSFLLIFGSRSLAKVEKIRTIVHTQLSDFHFDKERVCIMSGGAIGPDKWGIEWAIMGGFFSMEYLPDYQGHGRAAPVIRDKEMAYKCDFAIGFWDGESKGTAHTKKFLLDYQKPLVFFEKQKDSMGFSIERFNWETKWFSCPPKFNFGQG